MTQADILERGGKFVPPLLAPALLRLENGFKNYLNDAQLQAQYKHSLQSFAGRPTPLTYAKNLSRIWGGEVFLKREDLLHGGAHKLNNALGQCIIAQSMGFSEVIAETGAGQHGVATAMAAAQLGLKARIFQGARDVERQRLNALRMNLFGATLIPVPDGSATLKEAVNAAMREWVGRCNEAAYCLGSIVGPHPYPSMVRYFQKIIGEECSEQIMSLTGSMPQTVVACVGGGSNAAGMFSGFVHLPNVQLVACEAAGAASLTHGKMGLLHGMESLLLMTKERNIAETHSISAGLDYPGVGPWLAGLKLDGRLSSLPINDKECVLALEELACNEGILCALESAHALAGAKKILADKPGQKIVICVSGRGDKDLETLLKYKESAAQ